MGEYFTPEQQEAAEREVIRGEVDFIIDLSRGELAGALNGIDPREFTSLDAATAFPLTHRQTAVLREQLYSALAILEPPRVRRLYFGYIECGQSEVPIRVLETKYAEEDIFLHEVTDPARPFWALGPADEDLPPFPDLAPYMAD